MGAVIEISQLLAILALFLGLFYAFQNFTLKQNKSRANKYFTYYLLALSFIVLFFLLAMIPKITITKFLIPALVFASLILSPLLWTYVKLLISGDTFKINKKHYLIPFIYSVILTLDLILMQISSENSKLFFANILSYMTLGGITVVFLTSTTIYSIKSLIALKKHQKNIQAYFSYTEKVDLKWIKILIYGYIFLIIGFVISNLVKGEISDYLFYGTLIIYLLITGNHALKQKVITYSDNNSIARDESNSESEQQFTDQQQELFSQLKSKIIELFEQEKLYLDQELTILKLAKILETNTKYLSYIINNEFNQNFINFINEFRINEVKKTLLADDSTHLTIEAIAQNAGFKSKSSFNSAFKKATGLTPSAFVKKNK